MSVPFGLERNAVEMGFNQLKGGVFDKYAENNQKIMNCKVKVQTYWPGLFEVSDNE